MISFRLSSTKFNVAVADWLKSVFGDIGVAGVDDVVEVTSSEVLSIPYVELAAHVEGTTIEKWRSLVREVKETLKGGRLFEHAEEILTIHPLRTESLHIRLTPIEDESLHRAAAFKHMTVSEFVRRALINAAEKAVKEKPL